MRYVLQCTHSRVCVSVRAREPTYVCGVCVHVCEDTHILAMSSSRFIENKTQIRPDRQLTNE